MRLLDVYLGDGRSPAGVLVALDNGDTLFRYDEAYAATPGAVPLSLSMPLGSDPFGDAATRAFFENLLPENDQMRRIMDLHGIDRSDFTGLLAHLGADCPGAISCVPQGADPVKNPGVLATDYDPLDPATLAAFIRRMARGQSLPDEVRDPSPVAGYQRKMALTRLEDGTFALPRPGTGAPTTHILKTPQRTEARDAVLERAAARLAEVCGLPVVVPELVDLDGDPSVLMARYDRLVADGMVRRLHQEDFAQALGLPASLKYERRGAAERAFNAAAIRGLLDRTAAPALSVRAFLKLTLFNVCVGNADNHAKNHSLIYRGPSPQLAPAYDLLPTRLNGSLHPEMGFRIGSARKAEDLTPDDMAMMLHTFGLSPAAALRFVREEIAPMILALDRAAEDHALAPKDLDDLIGANLEVVAAACGLAVNLRPRDLFAPQAGGWISGS
ncbi:MAG: serine/threonine-protein kinase HipA [Brevundimonas sp.]|jgi:serine/threonine-protein kinase HipA|uniref:HipA domain-containing protein n=1 Tax=Brevundimonas sp. TaxID=1871086 RepID=UPI0039E5DAF2